VNTSLFCGHCVRMSARRAWANHSKVEYDLMSQNPTQFSLCSVCRRQFFFSECLSVLRAGPVMKSIRKVKSNQHTSANEHT